MHIKSTKLDGTELFGQADFLTHRDSLAGMSPTGVHSLLGGIALSEVQVFLKMFLKIIIDMGNLNVYIN